MFNHNNYKLSNETPIRPAEKRLSTQELEYITKESTALFKLYKTDKNSIPKPLQLDIDLHVDYILAGSCFSTHEAIRLAILNIIRSRVLVEEVVVSTQ